MRDKNVEKTQENETVKKKEFKESADTTFDQMIKDAATWIKENTDSNEKFKVLSSAFDVDQTKQTFPFRLLRILYTEE